jgi:hypothetical protein
MVPTLDKNYEAKPDVQHLDKMTTTRVEPVADDADNGLLKSRHSALSIPRTLWVFRRAALYVLLIYTGYVCEGFEVGLILTLLTQLNAGGSIIANRGFIKQFGDRSQADVRALDPTWGACSAAPLTAVSTWSAMLVRRAWLD